MKFLFFSVLFLSQAALADFVYMQEDENGKAVVLKTAEGMPGTKINDVHNKNWAIYPDLTPDAQEFIYAEGPAGDDLHLTYLNPAKNQVQRFHHPRKGLILHPKFSKNGRLIFYSAPGENGKNTIYFFDRAQEVARQGQGLNDYSLAQAQTLDASEESYFPRPSADGNFVVYQRNANGKREVVLFDRVENKKKVIDEGMSPALSFDERWIAYTSKRNGNWNVYVQERTTGITIQATSDKADEMAPTFMADNTLAFASNKEGNYRLYKLISGEWKMILNADESIKGRDFYSPQFSGESNIKQGEKASFIGNARSSFGTISHNGKVYMCGGHQGKEHTYPPESFSDMFIVFNPETNTWTELAPRPAKAHGFQLAAMGNYIYAFGGFAYSAEHKPKWKSLSQIDRYDIAKNEWTTVGHMLEPRSSNAAITVEGKVYLVGGWNSTPKFDNDMDGKFHQSIEIFDLTSEKSELAPFMMPLPLRRAFTGVAHNGKLLLIGGLGQGASHFELLSQVTEINPLDGSHKELTPLPFATFAPAAEILGNELFVFGGMFKTGPMNYEYVSHIYGMDMDHLKWRHTGRSLKETKGFSQVFKLDEKTLGVLGGHHYFQGYDSPVSTFETFTK